MHHVCPACNSDNFSPVYHCHSVPVHSVQLHQTKNEAINIATGDIELASCQSCGFMWNRSFKSELQDYSHLYESTQSYSDTFNSFARKLAGQIIDRNQLFQKRIIEIGCGQGEFLSLICSLSESEGLGFDPAYRPMSSENTDTSKVKFIHDYYSEKYGCYEADLFICKMTLEHIPDVFRFTQSIRNAIGSAYASRIFFQVPNMSRILEECAFWDIYYEHCSYFDSSSLARLFTNCGFQVNDLWTDYDDQYLMIDASPSSIESSINQVIHPGDPTASVFSQAINANLTNSINAWQGFLHQQTNLNKKTVLWGSGSKAVAFLTTLKATDSILFTVDINPIKEGTFLAGTGQEVVSPSFLRDYQPDTIILMNPVYKNEVQQILNGMEIEATIVNINQIP